MSAVELRKQLIERIQNTDNIRLLEEVYRLLQLETDDISIYKLNDEQITAIHEARLEIKNGKFFTDQQANDDIDEWLNK